MGLRLWEKILCAALSAAIFAILGLLTAGGVMRMRESAARAQSMN